MAPRGTRTHWFPAKRDGWGWGPPSAWQGWVVVVTYVALALAGIPLVQASLGSAVYVGYLVLWTIAFIAICWLTGEPPRRGRGDRAG